MSKRLERLLKEKLPDGEQLYIERRLEEEEERTNKTLIIQTI